MERKTFIENVISNIKNDSEILGLALGGSWITNEIDEFSDIDMILVTENKIAQDVKKMISYANRFGNLLNGFTGEHVGEKRLLICLYDNPLLHVDIKFLTPEELYVRVENPEIVWERDRALTDIIEKSEFEFPYPDYQWIEDRFWTWIHYVSTKIGRGELFEAHDAISFLRANVIAPLLQIKNNKLPKALRKIEFIISENDLLRLKNTVPEYNIRSTINCLEEIIQLYIDLRSEVFTNNVELKKNVQKISIQYFSKIKQRFYQN